MRNTVRLAVSTPGTPGRPLKKLLRCDSDIGNSSASWAGDNG